MFFWIFLGEGDFPQSTKGDKGSKLIAEKSFVARQIINMRRNAKYNLLYICNEFYSNSNDYLIGRCGRRKKRNRSVKSTDALHLIG